MILFSTLTAPSICTFLPGKKICTEQRLSSANKGKRGEGWKNKKEKRLFPVPPVKTWSSGD